MTLNLKHAMTLRNFLGMREMSSWQRLLKGILYTSTWLLLVLGNCWVETLITKPSFQYKKSFRFVSKKVFTILNACDFSWLGNVIKHYLSPVKFWKMQYNQTCEK